MLENPNPIDAVNDLIRAEKLAQKGEYLAACREATSATQRLISCELRLKANLREALSNTLGCPDPHD
jgi:hypothetical protein